MKEIINLLDMNQDQISEYLASIGQPLYRAKQLYSWLMQGASLGEMTNLPKAMREKIAEDGVYYLPQVVAKQTSKDGTTKFLFRLKDGECIESVVMNYRHGITICVSSQGGCRMGCKFCASTGGGVRFSRNLTSGEMLGQVIVAQREIGQRIGGIVLMGIGEPLDNYDNVLNFIRVAGGEEGLGISLRSIAISTCGLADKIRQLAKEDLPITLTISLHAPDDDTRQQIMPINARWGVDEVLAAARDYFTATGRRVSFEYMLLEGINDNIRQAKDLGEKLQKYMRDMPYHVNLIPWNNVSGRFSPSSTEAVGKFYEGLRRMGVNATIRRTLGGDIAAACGQLRQGK